MQGRSFLITFAFILMATTNTALAFDTIKLCGCQESTCPGSCGVYVIGKCAPLCNCFDCSQFHRFSYVKPILQDDGITVTIEAWADDTCKTTGHMTIKDPAAVGWEGSCNNECWSTVSMMGSQGCSFKSSTVGASGESKRGTALITSLLAVVVMLACSGVLDSRD